MFRNPTRNGFGGDGGEDSSDTLTVKKLVYTRIQTHYELTCPPLFLLVHTKTRIPLAVSSLDSDMCLPSFTTGDRADEFLTDARKSDPRDLANFEAVQVPWKDAREIASLAKLHLVIDFPLIKEGERP